VFEKNSGIYIILYDIFFKLAERFGLECRNQLIISNSLFLRDVCRLAHGQQLASFTDSLEAQARPDVVFLLFASFSPRAGTTSVATMVYHRGCHVSFCELT
jgi:hypothetical protein